jgi:ADP-ribose pyrophosphatase
MTDAPRSTTGSGDASPDDRDAGLRERLVSTEVLRRSRILEFRIDTVELPDGSRSTRDIAGHPGAVAMVAVDPEGNVLLVRQWRHAIGHALLEIPAGSLDRHPDGSVEEHAGAARRELEEETGYRANRWRYLGRFYSAPGFTSELLHVYLATDLVPAHEDRLGPDPDERLELERMPLPEAIAMAERGEFHDAKSLVGLLWIAALKALPDEPPEATAAPPRP